MEMSFDHKPEDEPEMKRIKNAGGKVTPDGRVNGGLNLSRAIGRIPNSLQCSVNTKFNDVSKLRNNMIKCDLIILTEIFYRLTSHHLPTQAVLTI